MKNTFGNNISITLFGESHGEAIGAVIDGIAPGVFVDTDFISAMLSKRRPKGAVSTSRAEADEFKILSGVFCGKTTGTPICIVVPNNDTKSADYEATRWLARPSHADYAANCKYHGFEDYRGGGHFSGRITAALVAAGAIILSALATKGITIATHLKKCGGVEDRDFSDYKADADLLFKVDFPVLCDETAQKMQDAIVAAKNEGNSIGGLLETFITGLPAGVGEPWFDSVESLLSHALFSIPGVKGVEFGAGFSLADMKGSEANDPFALSDENVITTTNNNGGINGGITNGMPIVFRCAMKPTPTIGKEQQTIDMLNLSEDVLAAKGRHDPCIAHRAAAVVDCLTAIVLADMLAGRYGTDWLADE